MRSRISIVFIIFCAFLLWFGSARDYLSCVRIFFREKNIKNLALVDQSNDLPLEAFFESTDWAGTISTDSNETPRTSDVIITTSVAKFSISTIDWAMGRVYVILSDVHPSINTIWGVFCKFKENRRNNVIVIAKMATVANVWHFHRMIEFDCTKNSVKSLQVFAECTESEGIGNQRHSLINKKLTEKKCSLTVTATIFEPFTYYDKFKGFYKGIDYFLIKTIAQKLQIDVNFVRADANLQSIKCVVFRTPEKRRINFERNIFCN